MVLLKSHNTKSLNQTVYYGFSIQQDLNRYANKLSLSQQPASELCLCKCFTPAMHTIPKLNLYIYSKNCCLPSWELKQNISFSSTFYVAYVAFKDRFLLIWGDKAQGSAFIWINVKWAQMDIADAFTYTLRWEIYAAEPLTDN